jgi:hypothetical protein
MTLRTITLREPVDPSTAAWLEPLLTQIDEAIVERELVFRAAIDARDEALRERDQIIIDLTTAVAILDSSTREGVVQSVKRVVRNARGLIESIIEERPKRAAEKETEK